MRMKAHFLYMMAGLLLAGCGTGNATPQPSNQELVATAAAKIMMETQAQALQAAPPQPATPAPQPEITAQAGLPGLSPAQVVLEVESYGFACAAPEWDNTHATWRCNYVTDEYEYFVTIRGGTLDRVDMIEAAGLYYGQLDDYSDLTAVIFAKIAELAYEGSRPEMARSWIEQSLPLVQETGDEVLQSIGGVRYYLYALPSSQILEMGSLQQ